MNRSSRHSKICGDFGEALVLYWLSRHGYECARVDHTGIDLIAQHPSTGQRLGISVKCRTRPPGREDVAVNLDRDGWRALDAACNAFGCEPYIAVVVDGGGRIRCYLAPRDLVNELMPKGRKVPTWKVSGRLAEAYKSDPRVQSFELLEKDTKGWKP